MSEQHHGNVADGPGVHGRKHGHYRGLHVHVHRGGVREPDRVHHAVPEP